MAPAFGVKPTPGPGFQLSLDKTVDFRCTSSRFTNADERRRFRDGWPTHRSPPALYRVSVRSLTALRRCFLPTVGHPSAVAGLSYFVNRSHRWYTAFLKTFVLVQGTCTLLVNRHARRTKTLDADVARCCALQASLDLFTIIGCSNVVFVGPPRGSTLTFVYRWEFHDSR